MEILKAVFYTPIFNLLVFLYNAIPGHDVGVAIVLVTVILRLLTLPLNTWSIKSQKALQDLQPKLKAIQEQFKGDKEKQARETMALYSAEKVNPFSSCLPLLIQLPFLIALYQVLQNVLSSRGFEVLYPFVGNPGVISPVSLGLINLSSPSWTLALIAGVSQFFQAKMMTVSRPPQPPAPGAKDEDTLALMNKQMIYMMPIMTVVIAWSLPAGLALYWIVMNALAIAQQWWVFKKKTVPEKNTVPA
ncbi:YidC/Oxa1 family membrane protein insertase [Patescibacteria group bacterium]|nr:MAG: YidC/Oxa1 family membrane protein insertase [Patescibacteria group bacterium]